MHSNSYSSTAPSFCYHKSHVKVFQTGRNYSLILYKSPNIGINLKVLCSKTFEELLASLRVIEESTLHPAARLALYCDITN